MLVVAPAAGLGNGANRARERAGGKHSESCNGLAECACHELRSCCPGPLTTRHPPGAGHAWWGKNMQDENKKFLSLCQANW